MSVSVCVRERERERDRARKRDVMPNMSLNKKLKGKNDSENKTSVLYGIYFCKFDPIFL